MKKQRVISIVIMAALVCAVLTGCGEPCSCNPKAHLDYDAACGCGGKGCQCTPKVIAEIGTVPIYKKGDVSNTETVIYRMNGVYPAINATGFTNHVKAVVIVTGNSTNKTISGGKWVITVGEEAQNLFDIMNDSCSAPTVGKAHDGWTKLNRQVIANGNHNMNKVMSRVHA